jgi:hypothetical protein
MTVEEIGRDIAHRLETIKKAYFVGEMEVYFAARLPGNDNADFVVMSSNAKPEGLAAVAGRAVAAESEG